MWNIFEDYSNEGNHNSMPVSQFFTEQVFKSHDELIEWVRNTAFPLGYVIVKKRSKTDDNRQVFYITLICDRGGTYKFKKSTKNSGTKKINCPFELVGSYRKQYGGWKLRVVCDEHNHSPAHYMAGHAYARRLKEDETQLVHSLTSQNVASRNILSVIKERDANNVSTIRTIYNSQYNFRSSQNIGKTRMQAFMSILKDKHFLIECTVDDVTNELKNIFFVHPLSLDIWRAFPHVLVIDATYKTNKYNMPFVQIVGVTSTNKTFSIAFAFIVNEKEESYNWALTCLRSTLDNCMHPRVIVTDRELALMNACQQVFPDAARLLCRWHISDNIKRNCRQSINDQHEWDSFRAMWKILIDSPTLTSYNKNYEKIRSMLRKYPRVFDYVDTNWLLKYKEMFVSVWIDQHLNFRERTTNRVESQHARLKKYLLPNNYSLETFISSIDQFVKSQFPTIHDSLEKSIIFRNQEHNFQCLEELKGSVSLEALDILVGEIRRLYAHQIDSSNCGCKVRHSCGLPCACMLSPYLNSGECIPLDSIDVFWRKLDLKPSIFVDTEKICCESALEMFKEEFDQQPEPVKKNMLRRLRDFFRPSKTLIKEPVVQKNTRGRPSLKKKQQQKRVDAINQVPRRCSYSTTSNSVRFNPMELNEEPARHSSYVSPIPDLNEEPQSCYIDQIRNEIPVLFHPYISHIQNVEGDGHCGFRALCVCLGYKEDEFLNMRGRLIYELDLNKDAYCEAFSDGAVRELRSSLSFFEKYAPKKYWMPMPLTGFLVANTFDVIVTFLTKKGSVTIFPLWKGPEEFLYHRNITFALINDEHYVMVQLEENFPMPPTSGYWKHHRSERAAGWEVAYLSRLELYQQLKPRNRQPGFITIEDCL